LVVEDDAENQEEERDISEGVVADLAGNTHVLLRVYLTY
jgi:hypothetical protein